MIIKYVVHAVTPGISQHGDTEWNVDQLLAVVLNAGQYTSYSSLYVHDKLSDMLMSEK